MVAGAIRLKVVFNPAYRGRHPQSIEAVLAGFLILSVFNLYYPAKARLHGSHSGLNGIFYFNIFTREKGVHDLKKNKWLLLSIALNIGILVVFLVVTNKDPQSTGNGHTTAKTKYNERVSLFEQVETQNVDAVFVGDSITERSLWNELFPGKLVVNRGIERDTTKGLLKRLDGIIDLKPKQIFLLIGVNDLIYDKKTKDTIENYEQIILKLQEQAPDAELFIQSILPVKEGTRELENKTINALNEQIQVLAATHQVAYIDIHHKLKNESGVLEPTYTEDGLHLNGKAYMVWVDEIRGYIE